MLKIHCTQTRYKNSFYKSIYGFTLIELMITVAIIGIISAVAYPSFTEYMAKGTRASATTQLIAAQQWLESRYSENYSYLNADGSNTSLPANFQTAPSSGEGKAY